MSNEQDIQTLELSIEEANKSVNLGKALEKLHKNREFKQVIVEGYFREEAIRLVGLKSHPSMQSESDQAAIIREIDAIGALQQYFSGIIQQGNMAMRAIQTHEETLDELRKEVL